MNSLPRGITATPGTFRYGITSEDVAACSKITSPGASAVTDVDLEPVPDEQSVVVRAGELTLGGIGGMDAQVILRTGRVGAVPARVQVGRRDGPPRYPGDPKVWASVKLAIAIDTTTILREPVVDGCARTPGAYAQHVQGCHKYTAALGRLCPEESGSARVRAVLRPAEGGFLVTIDGADIGTVLTRDAAYASARVKGSLEVDAQIIKRQGKGRGYAVYLAVELTRPTPR